MAVRPYQAMWSPPFCPNETCAFHVGFPKTLAYKRKGRYRNRWGEAFQRFQCSACHKSFSETCFRFDYRFKKRDSTLSSRILRTFILGASNRAIGRHLYISEHCVRMRLKRMAKWALIHHGERLQKLRTLDEPICFDGLENFAGTQYDPNNINQAIGRDSLFIYDFNYAPLNRKGRMSDRQKLKRHSLEKNSGRYSPKCIRMASAIIFKRLLNMAGEQKKLSLLTDEHFQYRRALQRDLRPTNFEHLTVSSKATRNFQNILFPVNHADLMIRQQVAAFSRETIAFSKTPARMCQKYALFMIYKNYMSPQFTKQQVRRPRAHQQSPAEALGIESKILSFHEFFRELRTATQVAIPAEWRMFADDQVPFRRQV